MLQALGSQEASQLYCIQRQVWRHSWPSPAFSTSVQRKPYGSSCLLTKSKCWCPAFLHQPAGWGDSQSLHTASWHTLHDAIPTLWPEDSVHSHGRTAGESCAALCSLQGLNVSLSHRVHTFRAELKNRLDVFAAS